MLNRNETKLNVRHKENKIINLQERYLYFMKMLEEFHKPCEEQEFAISAAVSSVTPYVW